MDLLNVFRELVSCLKGKWILSDGGLLGVIREGNLLKWDDDIDLILDEDCVIDLSNSNLKFQEYFICGKVYSEDNEKIKKNPWVEYCNYTKMKHFDEKMNRAQILTIAKEKYKEEKKIIEFTKNHIDIFIVKKDDDGNYRFKGAWGKFQPHQYYTEEDMVGKNNNTLGFDIQIPKNPIPVLERIYGDTWDKPLPDFKYY